MTQIFKTSPAALPIVRKRPRRIAITLLTILLTSIAAFASIFGSVRGIVHDPQHRPVQNAMVMLKARSVNALNVANRRVELDNSLTFVGFHWNNPRELYVELRYRFHY